MIAGAYNESNSNNTYGTRNPTFQDKILEDKAEFDKILDRFRNEILKMRDNSNYLSRCVSKFTQPDVDVKVDNIQEKSPQNITDNLYVLLNEMTIENAKLIEVGSLLTKLVG